MKNLKFKSAYAKNFFSFGEKGIELKFEEFGNIILIQGINLDTGSRTNIHSNGAGKSSLIDIISYALYGKTVKKPKKLDQKEVVNSINGGKTEVCVEFDDYKVVRKLAPSSLQLFKKVGDVWNDISLGAGKKETQDLINAKIGLSHAAFCAIVVIDDSGRHTFLELDPEGKRSIVENILNLDCYRLYHENAKEYLKKLKATIKETTAKYSSVGDMIDELQKKIVQIQSQESNWTTQKNKEIALLTSKINLKQEELSKLDKDSALEKYKVAQEQLEATKIEVETQIGNKTKVETVIEASKKSQNDKQLELNALVLELQNYTNNLSQLDNTIKSTKKIIVDLENLTDGAKCDKCFGPISTTNYSNFLSVKRNELEKLINDQTIISSNSLKLNNTIKEQKAKLEQLNKAILAANAKVAATQTNIQTLNKKIEELSKVKAPDISVAQQLLEKEISLYKLELEQKEKEIKVSPYKEILESTIKTKSEKEVESESIVKILRESEKLLPYGEFFVEAFGDNGIRKSVIDGVIPSLNESIDFWLECLIDGNYNLRLNDKLEEKISICGVDTNYHGLSNGEKTRCNLAISQGWGYVGTLSAGKIPSISFLDEITGGGIDVAGVKGIFRMILELSKERQVLLTTHNQTLIDMLQGCGTLTVVKENGISVLEK